MRTEENDPAALPTLSVADKLSTEEALRESEERYRALFDRSLDCIYLHDFAGNFLDANQAALDLLGYRKEEIPTLSFASLFPDDQLPRVYQVLEELKTTGQQKQLAEFRLRHKDGRQILVETQSSVIFRKGKPFAIQGIARDVTERKRAEESLRNSRQLMEGIMNSLPVRVFWKDRNLIYLGCNAAFARDAGFADPKDLIGKDDYQMGWREQAELYRSDDRQVIESGCPKLLIEEPQTTPDGNSIALLSSKVPLRSSTGEITGMLGTYLDITDRKRAEEALRKSEQELRAILDATPFPVALVDIEDDKIEYWSRSALALFGHTAPTAAEWYQLAYPNPDYRREAVARWRPFLEKARRSGKAVNAGEYRVTCHDGSVRICELHVAFLTDRLIVTFHDITERKQLEDQYRQAQKMEAFGQLAGGVAHDFNNLLTIISGYSEILLSKLPSTDPKREAVKAIHEAGARAASLTRQLLAFSRQAMLEPRVLDLNEAVKETEKMLRRLIGEDILLNVVPDPAVRRVKVDPGLLGQVLMNLALNARDAMPRGGTLSIETCNREADQAFCVAHPGARPGSFAQLTVSDTGSGMTPETQARIFEPFFTTKGVGKGTGLGLAVVYGIIKQSDGQIEVTSEPGVGTSFKIYFPAVEEDVAARAADPLATTVRQGTETVLLVEDEEGVRGIAQLILETHGYKVLTARNGKDGLRVAGKHEGTIDLMVTDVVMPGMSGREMADCLLARHPHMKILFMSGYTDDLNVRYDLKQASIHFLQKPFLPLALANKVREILDEKA